MAQKIDGPELVNASSGVRVAYDPLPPLVTAVKSVSDPPIRTQGDRWARLVILLCCSPNDCSTLRAWAHQAATSYTSLRECCYMVQLKPLASRDFARLLRAALWSPTEWRPEAFLVVSDRRTLTRLERRSGLTPRRQARCIVTEYLERQRLIPHSHPALTLLRERLQRVIALSHGHDSTILPAQSVLPG